MWLYGFNLVFIKAIYSNKIKKRGRITPFLDSVISKIISRNYFVSALKWSLGVVVLGSAKLDRIPVQ